MDKMNALSHSNRNILLVVSITRGEHHRGRVFVKQKVNDIEEPAEVSVAVLLANGDERRRHASRDTDGVLNIKVLQVA